jgi:hypothetical protein
MSLAALGEIERAAKVVTKTANAVAASPTHRGILEPYVQQIVAALFDLERRAHAEFQQKIQRALPAPRPDEVGSWASSLRQNRAALAPLMALGQPEWIAAASANIRQAAGAITDALSSPVPVAAPPAPAPQQQPQASRAGLGSPSGAAVGAVVAASAVGADPVASAVATRKLLGIGLQVLAAAGAAFMARGLHKFEKKLLNDGLLTDDDAEPFQVRSRSQRLLDDEMPGATISLSPTADGEWYATVKRGSEVIARAPAKKPHLAAGDAVRRALEYEEIKRHDADAEIIDVTPRRGTGA